MSVEMTQESASAHKHLWNLCKAFEADVNRICGSPLQSLRPLEFYECIGSAVESAKMFAQFLAARSYEYAASEKRIEEADIAFSAREADAEKHAVEKIKHVQAEVKGMSYLRHGDETSYQKIVGLHVAGFLRSQENPSEDSTRLSYSQALTNAKELRKYADPSEIGPKFRNVAIQGGIGTALVGWISGLSFEGGFFSGAVVAVSAMLFYLMKRSDSQYAVRSLGHATTQEFNTIRQEMREIVATASARHDERVNATRSTLDSTLKYIEGEVQSSENFLLENLGRLSNVIDAWTMINSGVSLLDANRVSEPREDEEGQPCTRLIRIGTVRVSSDEGQDESRDLGQRLAAFHIPWLFDLPNSEHIVISTPPNAIPGVIGGVSTMIAQILEMYPPGLVRFLLIDPVGLGQNFASFHALADHDEKLITNRVWSDRRHIRDRLEEVVAHIEGVIQKYLRSDYETIDQYNEQAGEIAEAYRFVFIYGFPENFDRDSCLSLERIMANGPRCGVHVVMIWDKSKELPHGIESNQIIRSAEHYEADGQGLRLTGPKFEKRNALRFDLDAFPNEDTVSSIVEKHGRSAVDGSRVEVPFQKLMQRAVEENHGALADVNGLWSLDNSRCLAAPLGPTGARKIQQLILGEKGTTAHHMLLVGKTGSGKSNLLHVLILSLAEIYSPEQLQIFLVDFKEGVEFKDYAVHKLPHARVVAIESDLEFGLSVLRGMDAELARRGNAFRSAGVQEIASYRTKNHELMPRTLLIVDEFHELFNDEGPGSREALEIVERIVRQGRSFGMHLVLASQSISGLRLPRSILDQIGVRIAMQCSEADSRMVLSDENTAARLLNRAGEAIYNNKNGLIEGNNLFQTALLTEDERRSRLSALRERADQRGSDDSKFAELVSGPFVFEGNEPADFSSCGPFHNVQKEWPDIQRGSSLNLWVGEPIAMLPAHSIKLKRQSGSSLLVIGRDERLCFGVVFSSILSIAAQKTPETVVFHIVDLSSADALWADHPEDFASHFPHSVEVYGRRDLDNLLAQLAEEVASRNLSDAQSAAKIILVLFGMQRARNLRRENKLSFTTSSEDGGIHDNLDKILRDGPDVGVHTIIWCDTVQSLSRMLDNSSLNEIGHRIAGPLPASDSIKLFDDPVASKIEHENRMICYDDELVGVYTQIRPYLPCDSDYISKLGTDISYKWAEYRGEEG